MKFLVPADRAAHVLDRARTRLQPDPHAGGPDGDQYQTTTIYFDTEDLAVYEARGSFARSKYRIRRYGMSDIAFLERKLRTGRLLNKRRSSIACADLPAVTTPDQAGHAYRWFVARIDARRLAPITQVSYRRRALVGMTAYGPLRLTFDDDIRAQRNVSPTFAADGGIQVLDGHVVIEMKFCVETPAVLKHLVEEFNLSPVSMSKYRTSLGALLGRVRDGVSVVDVHDRHLGVVPVGLPGLAGA